MAGLVLPRYLGNLLTQFVDPSSFDELCSLKLISDEGNIDVPPRGRLVSRVLPVLEGGVGTGECPGQFVRQLGQDATNEPLF